LFWYGLDQSSYQSGKAKNNETMKAYGYVKEELDTQTYGQVSRYPLWKVSVHYISPMSQIRYKWKVKPTLRAIKTPYIHAQTHPHPHTRVGLSKQTQIYMLLSTALYWNTSSLIQTHVSTQDTTYIQYNTCKTLL